MRIKWLAIFSVLMMLPNLVSAAPSNISTSGDFSNGSAVAIIGLNFGANSLNIKWLGGATGVIESGTNGVSPANVNGFRFDEGLVTDPVISTTHFHSGTKSIYHLCNHSSNLRLELGVDVGAGDKFYATWWTRFSYGNDGQFKMFRLSYHNSISDSPYEMVLFNWTNSSDQWKTVHGPTTGDNVTNYTSVTPDVEDRWYRMELELTVSDYGVDNGPASLRMYDPDGNTLEVDDDTVMNFYTTQAYRWFIWQNYQGNLMTDLEVYTDDHFVQFTPARVELCNSSTWVARTHCEIQYPTSWSDTSIDIEVNSGSFTTGETAYLYVVDDNSEVNSLGYEIEIGSSGGPPDEGSVSQSSGLGSVLQAMGLGSVVHFIGKLIDDTEDDYIPDLVFFTLLLGGLYAFYYKFNYTNNQKYR